MRKYLLLLEIIFKRANGEEMLHIIFQNISMFGVGQPGEGLGSIIR
jgi:hypothetical protein